MGAAAWRLVKVCRAHKGLMIGGVLASIGLAVLGVTNPLIIKVLIDDVLSGTHPDWLVPVVLTYLGVNLLLLVFHFLKSYLFLALAHNVAIRLRGQLLRKLHRLPAPVLQGTPHGQLASMAVQDVISLQMLIEQMVPEMLAALCSVLIAIPVLFVFDWRMASMLFVLVPLFWWIGRAFNPRIQQAAVELQQRYGEVAQRVGESLNGTVDIRQYLQEEWEVTRSRPVLETVKQAAKRQFVPTTLSMQMRGFLFFLPLAVAYYWGGTEVLAGAMTVGAAVAFVQYFQTVTGPVNMLLELTTQAQGSLAVGRSLFAFLDQPEDTPPPSLPAATEQPVVGIALHGVSYHYGDGVEVLHDLTCHLPFGQTTALVGSNGAGKSTLIQLLLGLRRPTAGVIDYGELRVPEDLLYLSHQPFVFAGTVEENVAFGRPIPREKITAVLEQVGLLPVVQSLPHGLDTPIGPAGQSLSAGQLQRLALARVLAVPPKVLVLDEALSNVDEPSQQLLFECVRATVETVVFISHQREQVQWADHVVELPSREARELALTI